MLKWKQIKLALANKIPFLLWVKKAYFNYVRPIQVVGKPKVFCIGFNKTGTTSLEFALKEWGFKMGWQRQGEKLLRNYINEDFESIVKYCRTGEAFQDIPFSYPKTYIYLAKSFPDSKFILSVRENSSKWYTSVINFHKSWFNSNKLPTAKMLKEKKYHWKGFHLDGMMKKYGLTEENLYDFEIMTKAYEQHNKEVMNYFKNEPNRLLVIDIEDPKSYLRLAEFLNKLPLRHKFPWKNKTKT